MRKVFSFLILALSTLFFASSVKAVVTPGQLHNPEEVQFCTQAQVQNATYDPNQGELTFSLNGPTASDAQPQSLSIQSINGNNLSLTSSSVAPTSSGAVVTFPIPAGTFSQSSGSFDANLDNMGIVFEPQPNTQNQSGSCSGLTQKAQIQVAQQSQTQPQPPTGTGGNNGGGNIKTCQSTNSCSNAAGIPCDPDSGAVPGSGGVMTAIGCIPTSPPALIRKLMAFAAGIGGGIALLLIIMGAFQMMTNGANPEGLKKGREQFIAATIGLLFIIFSALILKIIGVDILNIPGFS